MKTLIVGDSRVVQDLLGEVAGPATPAVQADDGIGTRPLVDERPAFKFHVHAGIVPAARTTNEHRTTCQEAASYA